MTTYLPKSTYVKVGDTVYLKDSIPLTKEYKVVAVLQSTQLPYKDFVWLEDKDTKEIQCVLAEWIFAGSPTDQWREEAKPAETSYRSIENIDTKTEMEQKDHSTLSAEINEGKLPSEVLASRLDPLDEGDDEDLMRFEITERMAGETGAEDYLVEEFVDNMNLGKSIDNTYWGCLNSRRIAIRLDVDGGIKHIAYYVKASQTRPSDFFKLDKESGIVITAYKEDYILCLGDDQYYMTPDELDMFCADWELDYSQVKSSLTKSGKWTQVV